MAAMQNERLPMILPYAKNKTENVFNTQAIKISDLPIKNRIIFRFTSAIASNISISILSTVNKGNNFLII